MKRLLYISIFLNILFIVGLIIALLVANQYGLLPFGQNQGSEIIANLPLPNEVNSDEYKLEIIAENLEIPWAIAYIDSSTLLVTERTGSVRLIKNKELVEKPVYTIPNVVVSGEAGLMSMALHPNFDENDFVYIYFAYSKEDGSTALKVSRFEFLNDSFENEFVLIDNIPYGRFHAGGELKFGPDNKLYITTGDVTNGNLAQNTQSLAGKTLRLNDDGSIPADNPFVGLDGIKPAIFTVGHRNAQGIDWHPETGIQYQSEHGPSGFDGGSGQDEINLIIRGQNYGWPVIRGTEKKEGLQTPIVEYSPAIAPSSLEFYEGEMFPELKNHMLVGLLAGENILVIEINDREIINEFRLLDESIGRVRDILIAPDGSIYFTTSNTDGRGSEREGDDKVYRIWR